MCGFAGFLSAQLSRPEEMTGEVRRMTSSIAHRGPDSDGHWVDSQAGIAIGHRRLAIVELTEAGEQPMTSENGQFVIAFNGEIYNHLRLREMLESEGGAPQWRGHSDTETMLACIQAWGVLKTLVHCVGMFAFALWDKGSRTLTLGRDRIGEKPVYYGWNGDPGRKTFFFGSELKALRAHRAFNARVDRKALALYMRCNYIPTPFSIYMGIGKLPPGCILTTSLASMAVRMQPYWEGREIGARANRAVFAGSCTDAVNALDNLLCDAVQQQMMSDVPLGAFLSGGVDSSTVVALMQAQSRRPIKTFTIGFEDSGYNEARHARSVASYLGTDHTEMYVSPADALAVIPMLPMLYDEPFADSSQIPTFLLSRLARRNVVVALSGDGGDELFAGYNRYQLTNNFWGRLQALPVPLRKVLASILTAVPPKYWDSLAGWVRLAQVGDKIHKGARAISSGTLEELYLRLTTRWDESEQLVIGGGASIIETAGFAPTMARLEDVERMMLSDMLGYLPDDILAKVDRAAMAASLETRAPYLDHRVVEFAWQLPTDLKLRDGQTKWILRQVLYRYVPATLIERPKMGFSMPVDKWLRGPLREWAEDLLSERRLHGDGYFNPQQIRKKWSEHLSGRHNWQDQLWTVLMFQTWYDEQRDRGLSDALAA